MERLSFEETAFFHLRSTCEADIWWKAFTSPKKKSYRGKSPISTYLRRYGGRKSKVWKLMNNSLIFLEESFEFEKQYQTNMDTYTRLLNLPRVRFYIQIFNQNPSSPNYCLRRDPLFGIKKLKCLKYMTFLDSSSNYVSYCQIWRFYVSSFLV